MVRLLSCQYHSADRLNTQELMASQMVCNMVEAIHQLGKLRMSPEFVSVHATYFCFVLFFGIVAVHRCSQCQASDMLRFCIEPSLKVVSLCIFIHFFTNFSSTNELFCDQCLSSFSAL